MPDPLAEWVSLLRPTAPFSKLVVASSPWAVRRTELGRPFFFAVLEGGCHIRVDGPQGTDLVVLAQGDFLLIPASRGFSASSPDRVPPTRHLIARTPIARMPGGARVGDPGAPASVRMLVGDCEVDATQLALLGPLLPRWIHVSGDGRLSSLVQLLADEARADRLAREVVTTRLLEVLLIEALRAYGPLDAAPGVARGLSEPRLARALRCMHEQPSRSWTMDALAKEAAISRSTFFERFRHATGMAPMEYLLAWRMGLSKQMLQDGGLPIAEIAERVGYGSVSAFGFAFTRHVGIPPARYARLARAERSARDQGMQGRSMNGPAVRHTA